MRAFIVLLSCSLAFLTRGGPLSASTVVPLPSTIDETLPSQKRTAFLAGAAEANYTLSRDDNITVDSTYLRDFIGCHSFDKRRPGIPRDAETQVHSGFLQAAKFMRLDVIKHAKSKLDFNSAAAVEYFGPPGLLKKKYKDQIKDKLENFATIEPGYWTSWQIRARCDDPKRWCNSIIGGYAVQDDGGYAMINFCPPYFKLDDLDDKVNDIKNSDHKYDVSWYYNNKGRVFAHELFHIDWVSRATKKWGGNLHVRDWTIAIKKDKGGYVRSGAYGPMLTKTLARWDQDTAYYTSTNADSLAEFIMASYVQEKLDNTYPHQPIVIETPEVPPRPIDSLTNELDYLLIQGDDGNLVLNSSNPLSEQFVPMNQGLYFGASDGPEEANNTLTLTKLAPASIYPSEYLSSASSWVSNDIEPTDPLSVLAPVPTSCKYTVTSMAGITTDAYTIQPAIATMCLCNDNIQVGLSTVTGASSTSYLVCANESPTTISTMTPSITAPPTTSSTSTTSTSSMSTSSETSFSSASSDCRDGNIECGYCQECIQSGPGAGQCGTDPACN